MTIIPSKVKIENDEAAARGLEGRKTVFKTNSLCSFPVLEMSY